jgi:hypothetical protein
MDSVSAVFIHQAGRVPAQFACILQVFGFVERIFRASQAQLRHGTWHKCRKNSQSLGDSGCHLTYS